MSLTHTDSFQRFADAADYSIPRLDVDPKTHSLAPILQKAHDNLVTRVGTRNKAQRSLGACRAVRDFHRDELHDLVVAFGLTISGAEGKRNGPLHTKVFKGVAPSGIVEGREADVDKRMKNVIEKGSARGVPASVVEQAKAIDARNKLYLEARRKVAEALETLDDARTEEKDAKSEWLAAKREVRGKLQVLFKNEPRRVTRYFEAEESDEKKPKKSGAPAEPKPT